MLRRKPTAITLTTEDIAIYEDTRAREAHLQEQAAYQAAQQQAQAERQNQQAYQQNQQQQQHTPNKNQNLRDPSDELRPLHGDRRGGGHHVKSREERLGLVQGNSRG